MRRKRNPTGALWTALATLTLAPVGARAGFETPRRDAPEAPRFEVTEPGARLPLQATRHAVEVVGPVAHVTVTQVYQNAGASLLDATYVFPGSTRSAVASLVMRVGSRTIRADLRRKEEARRVFEQARQDGFRASLLEQERPNVFRMSLTNLRPGETVEVTLGYTELLEAEEGQYELVVPAVVAPRYGGEGEGLGERPTLPSGSSRPAWEADVRLADGLGVTELTSPTHAIRPLVDAQGRLQVALTTPGDSELVLRWRLAADRAPEAGVVLYSGQDESFFLLTVAPPRRVAGADIPPREIDFLLDVSCSMRGFPLDVAKRVMQESLTRLLPSDRFNVLFFAGGARPFRPAPVAATPENVAAALAAVDAQEGGGGTELVEALGAVARLPRDEGRARTIVVVTDGLVAFEQRAFAEVRRMLSDSAVFTLGIGGNVNRMLIEGLARAGGGTHYVAHDAAAAAIEAKRLLTAIEAPVLTRLRLAVEGLDAYDLEPPTLPDLYGDRPVVVVGKYRGPVRGRLRLSAHASDHSLERTLDLDASRPSASNAPLRALWARRRLQRVADDRDLADQGADAETIARLGLQYGLLTAHTAFVAVDSAGGRAEGQREAVVQPGPHPKGMEDKAASGGAMLLRRASSSVFGPSGLGALGTGAGGAGYGHGKRSLNLTEARGDGPPPPTSAPRTEREKAVQLDAESTDAPRAPRARAAGSAPGVVVVAGVSVLAGSRSAAEERRALEARLPELRVRLARGSMRLAERLVVELVVDARGRVTHARTTAPAGASASKAERLVLGWLRSIALGPDASGGVTTLRIVFEPAR